MNPNLVPNPYLIAVLAFLAGAWALETLLTRLNMAALGQGLPPEFEDVFDAGKYQQSQRYARTTARVNLLESTLGLIALAAFILAGGFNAVDSALRSPAWPDILTGLAYFAALSLLSGALSLPFAVYRTFVVEERFGFNTTTWRTFIADRLKGALLAVAVGGPLLAAVLWFFATAGSWAWVLAWGAAAAVTLIIQYLSPTLILPLFYRFTPLEEGPVREAVTGYAAAQGLELSGICVVDGSRRSRKANAFFTGLGRVKRIALFDTLLEDNGPDEITAVLAHETGHHKLGHIPRMTAMGIARSGLTFWLLSLFLGNEDLFAAFGMEHLSIYAALVFFGLLYTPLALVLSVAGNAVSRRFEFQADAFAARTTGDSGAMVSALKKLGAANLTNLTPHPAYVAVHYSHPPVLERIRTLESGTLESVAHPSGS